MKPKQNTGGSAFPQPPTKYTTPSGGSFYTLQSVGGMTLLDYFAAAALPICAGPDNAEWHYAQTRKEGLALDESIAREAYSLAAAMLAEKRRREGGVK